MAIIADASAALAEIFTPRFRSALWKVLGLTVCLLALAVIGLHRLLTGFVHLPSAWLQATISIIAGLSLLVGSIFLVAPVSALVAGFFVDDLATLVERDVDPDGEPGRPLPLGRSIVLSLRFAVISIAITILALVLLLVPGINAIAFLAANSYLLGRQFFEFAALRFRPQAQVDALRRRNFPTVMLAGFCIALFVAVPVLNLLTPMFGTALMVRVHKRIERRSLRLLM